jgi:hypothetical protein
MRESNPAPAPLRKNSRARQRKNRWTDQGSLCALRARLVVKAGAVCPRTPEDIFSQDDGCGFSLSENRQRD